MMAADRGAPLRVVGRYALYNEIAAGGMATVHIGRLLGPVGFARTVAVKRLHPQFAKDPEFVSMFLDEARLAARVQHPNVIATIDVVATGGELFLIMDYVRGESLSKLLRAVRKRGERMPPRIAASICCGFLHGLHAAHEAKNERGDRIDLVHRDISPQNVLVGADGIARVLDFGIAKAAGRIQVTRDGQIKGKLAYMPPEQLSGRELTRAVDIYAAAVVMWETLTGERLFKGETESETLAKILRDDVLPPSAIVPGLPEAFDRTLLRALSRDPSERHATARELALEIERCVGVASGSEVGEWVEQMVGPVLSARENEIALIEQSSSTLRISPESSDTDSDSDVLRIAPPLGAAPASSRDGTLLGIGSTSAPSARESAARLRPPTPTQLQTVTSPMPRPADEATGSRVTGTASTATLTLPTDRRLPILASAAGVIVLLVILFIVIFHNRSDAAPKASPAPAISAAPLVIGDPPPSAVPDPDPAPPPAETVSSAAPPPPTPPPHVVIAKPPPIPTGVPTTRTAPAALKGKDCTPPWTFDANGRKKYKLECM